MELVREVAGVSLATQRHYIIKRAFWSIFERVFRVWTRDGQLFMYVKHPIFRLREELMVYGDEAQTRPLLKIKSKQMIAINFSYEITDANTGAVLGAVEKRGLRSIVRDRFLLLDAGGDEIGYAEEQGAAVLRRFLPWLSSEHAIFSRAQRVALVQQRFRFFTKEFEVELQPSHLDPRFVLAVALLALLAEARRERGWRAALAPP